MNLTADEVSKLCDAQPLFPNVLSLSQLKGVAKHLIYSEPMLKKSVKWCFSLAMGILTASAKDTPKSFTTGAMVLNNLLFSEVCSFGGRRHKTILVKTAGLA